jgi:hypothetical protein
MTYPIEVYLWPYALIAVSVYVGAHVLRWSCIYHNRRSSATVPQPTLRAAIGIWISASLASTLVTLVVGYGLRAAFPAGADNFGLQLLLAVIAALTSFLTFAGLIAAMLPTSFKQGLLVALIHYVIAIGIGGTITLVGYMLYVLGAALFQSATGASLHIYGSTAYSMILP